VEEMLKDMKGQGVTEESGSPWLLPIVLIRKKNETFISVLNANN
jgi:hypothetical protein